MSDPPRPPLRLVRDDAGEPYVRESPDYAPPTLAAFEARGYVRSPRARAVPVAVVLVPLPGDPGDDLPPAA